MIIRPYQSGDRDAVHDICIRTADAGEDASTSYADPNILPEIFAHPYTHLEPDLAFVLDDGGRAVGYVLGTADTRAFAARFRDEWLPLVTHRYPPPTGEPTTPDAVMAHLLHTPERMVLPELADHPAHLHIDLLAGYRRSGHGRALVDHFLTALRERGAPALHVGMVTANRQARPFYDRLGFWPLPVPDPGPLTYLGLEVPGLPSDARTSPRTGSHTPSPRTGEPGNPQGAVLNDGHHGGLELNAAAVRIARPCTDLAAAARFYVDGLGLDLLHRIAAEAPDEHDLLILGRPDANWHLELVGGAHLTVKPTPTTEDLLVLYLGRPVDDTIIDRLQQSGGRVVSQGPYWDRWGVTVEDPDGYRLVLSTRTWSNAG